MPVLVAARPGTEKPRSERGPSAPAPDEPRLTAPWCRATWLIGLGAFVVRGAVVLAQPLQLRNDAADYQRLAASLATGHGFGISHFAPGGGPTALRPPLYPLALAALYKVMGTHLLAARMAGALLGALTVVLLVVVTWLLCGRRVGLVAGALAAVFPPQILATTSLMSEALALPLELSAFLLAVVYRRTGRLVWAAGSGGVLGLLVLTRPSLAVLVVALAVLLYRRLPSWRQLAAAAVLVAAGTVVVVPWVARDRLSLHAWVPVTTQSGYVLAGTYNATSAHDARFPAAWRPANLDPADAALLRDHPRATEVQTDALLQFAALHYASAHPAYVVKVAYENSRRLLDLEPVGQIRADTASEYGVPGPWGTAEMVSGLMLLLLALGGLATAAARRVPVAWKLAPAILWVSTVVLQAVPRFRAVIDPFLLPFAAAAVVAGAGWWSRRRQRVDAPSGP